MREPTLDILIKSGFCKDPDHSEFMEIILGFFAFKKDRAISNQLLSRMVLEFARSEREISRLNEELKKKQEQIDEDLKAAAGIQGSFLPSKTPSFSNICTSWKFVPSGHIGGDAICLHSFDRKYLSMAIIDVSGHGVSSALVTVSLLQFLHPHMGMVYNPSGNGKSGIMTSPKSVLSSLYNEYPFSRFEKLVTIFYAVLEVETGKLTYSNAGHPFPILFSPGGSSRFLDVHGPIIGLERKTDFPEETIGLQPGERLYLYTDGVTEARDLNGEFYGIGRFRDFVSSRRQVPLETLLKNVLDDIWEFSQSRNFRDDFTLFALEYKKADE